MGSRNKYSSTARPFCDKTDEENAETVKAFHKKKGTKYMVRFCRRSMYFEWLSSEQAPSLAIQEALQQISYGSRGYGADDLTVYKYNPRIIDGWGYECANGYFESEYSELDKINEDEYNLSPSDWFEKTGEIVDNKRLKYKFRRFLTSKRKQFNGWSCLNHNTSKVV